jgi:hypothetical protein
MLSLQRWRVHCIGFILHWRNFHGHICWQMQTLQSVVSKRTVLDWLVCDWQRGEGQNMPPLHEPMPRWTVCSREVRRKHNIRYQEVRTVRFLPTWAVSGTVIIVLITLETQSVPSSSQMANQVNVHTMCVCLCVCSSCTAAFCPDPRMMRTTGGFLRRKIKH